MANNKIPHPYFCVFMMLSACIPAYRGYFEAVRAVYLQLSVAPALDFFRSVVGGGERFGRERAHKISPLKPPATLSISLQEVQKILQIFPRKLKTFTLIPDQ